MKKENKKLLLLISLVVVIGAVVLFIPDNYEATPTEEAAVEESVAQEAEATDQEADVAATNIVMVDQQAPEFTLEMTDGKSVTLESLRGKVVLLNFWATWCPPCREELKRVQADLIDRFEGRDFVFLPVSRGEKKETVISFLKENNYTFAAGLDPEQAIYDLYAKNYIPRNYLINRHGVVVKATIGYDAKEFEELLQTIEMSLNAR